jgi:monoterpene epsilon-lactone hydrolase
MPSIQSRLLYVMMRYHHLLNFRLKREAWDFNTSIPAFRERCEKSAARLAAKMPENITVTPVQIGNMYAEWLTPAGAPKDRAILYNIGGGYVSGSCNDHRNMVAKVALGSGISVLQFNHRLAPEDPFPAALDDAVAAYRWLLAQGFAPDKLMIFGESAGGGLCLAALLALRDLGDPLPAAAVALSPWTDLLRTGESQHTKVNVCLSPLNMAMVCSKYYVGDNDPANPWISPLYGDLHGLPPLFICVGDYETLLDDSTRFAAKAKDAGVDVTLLVGETMVHCYPLMAGLFPEATQAMETICNFIKKHIG